TGISDSGVVIGWVDGQEFSIRGPQSRFPPPVPWTGGAKPSRQHIWAINEAGDAVGNIGDRAVVWRKGHRIILPVPAMARESNARAINERGDVAGSWSPSQYGPPTACVWTATGFSDLPRRGILS